MILAEGVGDVFLILIDGDGAEILIHDLAQHHGARMAHDAAERDRADRFHRRVDDDDVIERVGQIVGGAHVVDHLTDGPERRGLHQLPLHHAPGGFLRVGERLFDDDPVVFVERVKQLGLRLILKVFDEIDDVVAVHLLDCFGEVFVGN